MRNGSPLLALSCDTLRALAAALAAGRLSRPVTDFALRRFVDGQATVTVARALQSFFDSGMSGTQIAMMLELLTEQQSAVQREQARIELVWTGPEGQSAMSRDTSVVVQELFAEAKRSLLIAGFVVYQGKDVFRTLAQRMDEYPGLEVRMFLNVARESGDVRNEPSIVSSFAKRFSGQQWPGKRLPELFYDPRALGLSEGPRACLHAKCIVVDDERALVTSANLTEAAQIRNIEAGVLVAQASLARALRHQFETLVATGQLRRVDFS